MLNFIKSKILQWLLNGSEIQQEIDNIFEDINEIKDDMLDLELKIDSSLEVEDWSKEELE